MNEVEFRRLISGERRGFAACLQRAGLSILSLGYGLAISLWDLAYRLGFQRVDSATVPVISLGNLTTGGTGKTPLAAEIARRLRDRHWERNGERPHGGAESQPVSHPVRVCFLSRGYRAGDQAINDEALVLEQLCPDVPHLQHRRRIEAARVAVEELESQLLVLDDGYQHRQLTRDLNLLLVDATNPWGYGHLLPRGLLREPKRALRRADLILITRCDQVAEPELSRLVAELQQRAPGRPIVRTRFQTATLSNWSGQSLPLAECRGQRFLTVCAIGNPEAFRQQLIGRGIEIIGSREFADHHRYSRSDVEQLREWAAGQDVAGILTTRKDLVKLQLDELGGRKLWSVDQQVEFLSGEAELDAALQRVMRQVPAEFDGP